MKKVFSILVGAALALTLASCGSLGVCGAVYTNTTTPFGATNNNLGDKVGTAKCTSYVGVVALGDAGIQTAAKNAGITRISHVDVKRFSVLGLYSVDTYIVYGN